MGIMEFLQECWSYVPQIYIKISDDWKKGNIIPVHKKL